MLKNYLTIALRNLRKHIGYSLINVTGLALGLACFILILFYVRDELRYDRHYARADDIYRVVVDIRNSNGFTQTAQSPAAWGPDLQREYPEVTNFVRMKPPNQKWMIGRNDLRFYEKEVAFVDSTVFDVFDLTLLRGNPATALDAPFTMVISESVAARYFGTEDPMGQTITLDNQYDFEVTGIMADMPRNGHFHFGFLPSIATLAQVPIYGNTNFLEQQFPAVYTYILLDGGASPDALEEKLPAFIDKYVGARFPLRESGIEVNAFLQPLTDIHLRSHRENEIAPNGEAATVRIFLAVGFFILIIASINFMNLATARSANRAKEVGLRKVVGAQREHLILQFLGESTLLGLIALLVAVVLVELALPEFNTLTGKALTLGTLVHPAVLFGLFALTLCVGLLAGSYPAFFLSAFRPAAVLKGEQSTGSAGGRRLRKALIVFQFSISLVLIIGTGIVYQQLDYARSKQLGFDKEHVVVIQLTDPTPRTLYGTFRQAVENVPNVLHVSASSSAPAHVVNEVQMRPVTAAQDENWLAKAYFSDFAFVETMGMHLRAGRTLSPDFPTDTLAAIGRPLPPHDEAVITSIVINETAAAAFGWDDPAAAIGREIRFTGNNAVGYRIVGVVDDFHSQSVHEKITPAMIAFGDPQTYFYVFVRVRAGDIPGTVAALERTWNEIMPNYAFEYTFLDEDFAAQYRADTLVGTLLGYFALLTVFIACLGLFGLASFMAEQRRKEIGVRKSLGATVPGIVLLLSKDFAQLVLIAFVLAAPVAYFAMHRWLDAFAYRITISWTIFLAAGLSALLVAVLTVSYQSVKAALTDPVKALRYE